MIDQHGAYIGIAEGREVGGAIDKGTIAKVTVRKIGASQFALLKDHPMKTSAVTFKIRKITLLKHDMLTFPLFKSGFLQGDFFELALL